MCFNYRFYYLNSSRIIGCVAFDEVSLSNILNTCKMSKRFSESNPTVEIIEVAGGADCIVFRLCTVYTALGAFCGSLARN
jgi:hypothetical protein